MRWMGSQYQCELPEEGSLAFGGLARVAKQAEKVAEGKLDAAKLGAVATQCEVHVVLDVGPALERSAWMAMAGLGWDARIRSCTGKRALPWQHIRAVPRRRLAQHVFAADTR